MTRRTHEKALAGEAPRVCESRGLDAAGKHEVSLGLPGERSRPSASAASRSNAEVARPTPREAPSRRPRRSVA